MCVCVVSLLAALVLSTQAATDNVLSGNIKEADGTSGQDTNSGSGVKTDHIQDGAVTDDKISGVLSIGKLPVGSSAGTVAAGDHIHDGIYQQRYANVVVVAKSGGDYTEPLAAIASITDASATNPYLVKIMPGVYDFGNLTLDMKEYVDIEGAGEGVTVLTSAVYNGTSEATRGTVNGADYAELRFLTVNGVNEGGSLSVGAIVNVNASPKLTHVTASATAVANLAYGVSNLSDASPIMTHVTAKATQLIANTGAAYGVMNQNSSPVMTDVTAVGTGGNACVGIKNNHSAPSMSHVIASGQGATHGYAISNENSSLAMSDVVASSSGSFAAYGILNYASSGSMKNVSVVTTNGTAMYNYDGGDILADHCSFDGSANGIFNDSPVSLKIGASKIVGGFGGAGASTCVSSYDGNYALLSALCQ